MLDSCQLERTLVGLTSNDENCSTRESWTETKYAYDELDRVLSKSYSDGSSQSLYTYDVDTWGATNPKGRVVKASRGSGASEYYSYNPMGRVISQTNPRASNTNTNAYPIAADYDFAGNLKSITYPDGRVVSQSFDTANRLTSVTYTQWGGQILGAPESYMSSVAYTPTGAMTSATLGNGVQVTATYNKRQAITSLKYMRTGAPIWSKEYSWAANAQNLLAVSDKVSTNSSKAYVYDQLNRITKVSTFDSASATQPTPGTATITVSGGDQTTTVNMCPNSYPYYCPATIPNGGTVTVTISGTAYSTGYGQGIPQGAIASNLAGAMNNGSLVTATASGNTITIVARTTGPGSNYPISTSCTYNAPYFSSCGWSASAPGALSGGADATYPGATTQETYSYDSWGNLKQSGIFPFEQNFGVDNRVSGGGYVYDQAGNMTQDGIGNSYSYTSDGMLSGSGGANYAYDGDSKRVRKDAATGAIEYFYFAGQLIAERNVSTGAWTDFINGPSGPMVEVAGSQNAPPIYRVTDQLSSLAQRRDSSGVLIDAITFLPYGQTESGSTTDPLRFTGLEFDSENGSYHAWYRQHSPAQGRWLSADRYQGSYDFSNPQTLNRYAYVNGRPLYLTDPSGLDGDSFCSRYPQVCAFPPLILLWPLFHHGPKFHGSLEPRPSVGRNFPNGESSGIPAGMSLPDASLANIFLPQAGRCEFGTCAPIGNSVVPAAVPIAAGCLAQPEICVTVLVGSYVIVRYGPQIVSAIQELSREITEDWEICYLKLDNPRSGGSGFHNCWYQCEPSKRVIKSVQYGKCDAFIDSF
jgi:RHS repeat-associated protein